MSSEVEHENNCYKDGSKKSIDSTNATDDDNFQNADDEEERLNKMCFCRRLFHKFDRNFMIVFGVLYANNGLRFLMQLALQDLFKNYYRLEPSQT